MMRVALAVVLLIGVLIAPVPLGAASPTIPRYVITDGPSVFQIKKVEKTWTSQLIARLPNARISLLRAVYPYVWISAKEGLIHPTRTSIYKIDARSGHTELIKSFPTTTSVYASAHGYWLLRRARRPGTASTLSWATSSFRAIRTRDVGTWDAWAHVASPTSIMVNRRSSVEVYDEGLRPVLREKGVIFRILRSVDHYFVIRPILDPEQQALAESSQAFWPSGPASIVEYDLQMRHIRSIKTLQRYQMMAASPFGDVYVLTGGCEAGGTWIVHYTTGASKPVDRIEMGVGTGLIFTSAQGYVVASNSGCGFGSSAGLRFLSARLMPQAEIPGIAADSILDFQ